MAMPGANYVTLPGMSDQVNETIEGDGYAVSNLSALGEGPGFRKIRVPLGVTAFGIKVEIEFGDGSKHRLGPGGLARVDASTVRRLRNVGSGEATYVCVGGADGYVGRDGQPVEGEDSAGGFGR
jgi:hypothetical protein